MKFGIGRSVDRQRAAGPPGDAFASRTVIRDGKPCRRDASWGLQSRQGKGEIQHLKLILRRLNRLLQSSDGADLVLQNGLAAAGMLEISKQGKSTAILSKYQRVEHIIAFIGKKRGAVGALSAGHGVALSRTSVTWLLCGPRDTSAVS